MKKTKYLCNTVEGYKEGDIIPAYLICQEGDHGLILIPKPKGDKYTSDCLVFCKKVRRGLWEEYSWDTFINLTPKEAKIFDETNLD